MHMHTYLQWNYCCTCGWDTHCLMTILFQVCTVCHQEHRQPVHTAHSSNQNQNVVVCTASPVNNSCYIPVLSNHITVKNKGINQAFLLAECTLLYWFLWVMLRSLYEPIPMQNIFLQNNDSLNSYLFTMVHCLILLLALLHYFHYSIITTLSTMFLVSNSILFSIQKGLGLTV